MNDTDALCQIIDRIDMDSLSPAELTDIRYRLLDWLGCVLGAGCTQTAKAVFSLSGGYGASRGRCTTIGISTGTAPAPAAFVNGMLSHALEYDDTNKIAITHPGGVVVAAALAAAEQEDADFGQFAASVAAGYEVMIRLGGALNPSHYRYWHTTGTCGAFAAAAVAGKLMGLDKDQMRAALGIAATMASGLVAVFGTEAKLATVGNAAANGIIAASLAKAGFTAPEDIIGGDQGYAVATSTSKDLSYLTQSQEMLLIHDAYYKIHASCGHTHSALDTVTRLLKEQPFDASQVEEIHVGVYQTALALTGALDTSTALKAKFSMPYCIAACIVLGQVNLDAFTEKALSNERILSLAARVKVVHDPACDEGYPAWRRETLRIALKDGRVLVGHTDLPDGHPPAEFLENKFSSLACRSISPEKAWELQETVLSLNGSQKMSTLGTLIRKEVCYGQ